MTRTDDQCFRIRRLGQLVLRTLALATTLAIGAVSANDVDPVSSTATTMDSFESAAAVIVRRCLECHQMTNPSGGLDLSTRDGMVSGGESGPVINREHPADSYLLARAQGGEMPPPVKGIPQRLAAEELAALQTWIAAGAHWPEARKLDLYERTTDVRGGRDWWSLQPVVRREPPVVESATDVRHPVDRFVRAKLNAAGMSPAPEADRRTLIRRLYNDLLGLPPSAAEIDAFVGDADPQAWERLVDRLLESPHFGERWARHWLDLVRYAETSGYERDQTKPFAWKYRDWVVRAFNSDLPYDRFLVMQLAGDELAERSEDDVIATGFLSLGTWNDEPNDPDDYQYERLEDLVHVTSTAFLGLSVKCARCHDHKFDPIPQVDYYRMASAFWAGPIAMRDRALVGGPSVEELGMADVLGWTDITTAPAALHVLKNGERHHPLQAVEPASLTCWPAGYREFEPPPEGAKTTQRRLQLARWLADPRHPLTARVIVNRLWQEHFGHGLVRSPNNFGFTGETPTHPELLDWLASELVSHGWSLKHIHRLLVTSATYKQASVHPDQESCSETDAGNRLWWRAERRRLDAEALRDAILSASGEIDLRIGGESFRPTISPEALEGLSRKDAAYTASPEEDQRRRSLYIFIQRSLLPPLMTTFDLSDTTLPCGQRDVTIVAPQALALLNNQFLHQQAAHLARRGMDAAPGDDVARVRTLWRAVLGRDPLEREVTAALAHVARQRERFEANSAASRETGPAAASAAWASLCVVLFNTNEFLFVD